MKKDSRFLVTLSAKSIFILKWENFEFEKIEKKKISFYARDFYIYTKITHIPPLYYTSIHVNKKENIFLC